MKKRYLIAAVLAMLCCMALLVRPAMAEDEIKATVTATPNRMSEAGQVTFTFEISNYSEYQISGISITDFDGTSHEVPLGVDEFVQPNGSVRTDLILTVPEGKLGTPLKFSIDCIRSGESVNVEAEVTVERAAEPVITVDRTASATMVREGDSVTISYTLKNETRFDMTDITMIDENVSDTPILKEQLLRANDSISRTTTIPMGSDDIKSAPVVTYTVNGKTKSFSGIEEITIQTVLVKLAMQIDAGLPTAAGVVFTIEVKNTGNQEVRDIAVTDERNNPINDAAFSLSAGESNTFSYTVVPLMTEAVRSVGFRLKGTDALDQPYTLSSEDTYDVYPFVDDAQINVSMKTETVTPWTSDTGKLVMRVTITNNSQVELRNAAVSESMLGVLKTYDVLLAGETTFDQEMLLGSPRNLQLTIKGNDPTGASRELASATLPVAYGTEETPAPDATSLPENNTGIFSFLSTTISKILLGLGVLMVVAFIVLITLSIAERSAGGRMRLVEEVDDEEEDDEIDAFFDERSAEEDYHTLREAKDAYFTRRNGIAPDTEEAYTQRTHPRSEPADERRSGRYGSASWQREPQVRVEYEEEDYPPQSAPHAYPPPSSPESASPGRSEAAYRPAGTYARPAAESAPIALPPPEEPRFDEAYDPQEQTARPPKVIDHKPKPAVQPARRNTVKHVRKAPKDK